MDSPVVVGHPYPIVEVCDHLPERLRCARHDALSKAVTRAQIHEVRALAVAVDEFAAAEERPTVVIDHVSHFIHSQQTITHHRVGHSSEPLPYNRVYQISTAEVPVKRHGGSRDTTRDTRDTRAHAGTRITRTNLTTIHPNRNERRRGTFDFLQEPVKRHRGERQTASCAQSRLSR